MCFCSCVLHRGHELSAIHKAQVKFRRPCATKCAPRLESHFTKRRWICQLALALLRKCLVSESSFSVQDDWSQVSVPLGAVEVCGPTTLFVEFRRSGESSLSVCVSPRVDDTPADARRLCMLCCRPCDSSRSRQRGLTFFFVFHTIPRIRCGFELEDASDLGRRSQFVFFFWDSCTSEHHCGAVPVNWDLKIGNGSVRVTHCGAASERECSSAPICVPLCVTCYA